MPFVVPILYPARFNDLPLLMVSVLSPNTLLVKLQIPSKMAVSFAPGMMPRDHKATSDQLPVPVKVRSPAVVMLAVVEAVVLTV